MLELDHLTVSGDVTFGKQVTVKVRTSDICERVHTLCAYPNLLFLYNRERLSLSLITETESTSRPERCWRTRSFQETCASWTTETFTSELQPHPSRHLDIYMCVCVCLCVSVETCASWTPETFRTELQPHPSRHLDIYMCVSLCLCVCGNLRILDHWDLYKWTTASSITSPGHLHVCVSVSLCVWKPAHLGPLRPSQANYSLIHHVTWTFTCVCVCVNVCQIWVWQSKAVQLALSACMKTIRIDCVLLTKTGFAAM